MLLPISPSSTLLLSLLLLSTPHIRTANAYAADDSDPPPPTSTPQVSDEYTSDSKFQAAVLNATNTYRRQHNASNVVWNGSLATAAEKWGARCIFEHSAGPTGENLASGYPNTTSSISAWGDERTHYSFRNGKFSKSTGHFTQLVWKATRSVGCSRTDCEGKGDGSAPGWYLVCEYWPPGNVVGAFKENVQSKVKGDGDGEECLQGAVCSGGVELGLAGSGRMMVVLGVVVSVFGGGWLGVGV